MMTRADELEAVLDAAFRDRPRARSIRFTREELQEFASAHGIVHTVRWWGHTLQDYRKKESHRYRITAQGYGIKASWLAIAKVGAPAIHRLRQSQEHHLYVVQDAIKREASDLNHEVLPALVANKAHGADIRHRINEFEVLAVQRLTAAGVERDAALLWIEPIAEELRERFAS